MIKKLVGLVAVVFCSVVAVSAQDFDFASYAKSNPDKVKVKLARQESIRRAAKPTLPLSASVTIPVDPDVPPAIKKQLADDLESIKMVKSTGTASQLHKQIFGEVNGETYYSFFVSRVKAIGMDDCGSGTAVACIMPYVDPSKMWITQNYIKFSHPEIARLMVVFHESRHTETEHGNWSHATCPTPFQYKSIWTGAQLAGEPACDTTPLGSYGSSTIMLKNISKYCANCNDKMRKDAGIYADDQLNRMLGGAKDAMRKDVF